MLVLVIIQNEKHKCAKASNVGLDAYMCVWDTTKRTDDFLKVI
jgi:hypothetical protein